MIEGTVDPGQAWAFDTRADVDLGLNHKEGTRVASLLETGTDSTIVTYYLMI